MVVWSLGWENPLEEEMATHSSILAWRIPWTEEPGGLQSVGLQTVEHDWMTEHNTTTTFSCWWFPAASGCFDGLTGEDEHTSFYPDNHDAVTTHLEPDILEWEAKWALGIIIMNKTGGGDGMPAELFQILKDDPVKVLHSIRQQIGKTRQWPQDWKRSVFIPTPKKGNAKDCSDYHPIALISHASKVMLKILQARFQHYVNWELPDI